MSPLPLVLALWVSASAAEPRVIAPEEWGSTPGDMSAIPEQTSLEWITIHHASVFWTDTRDPVRFICGLQSWGKIPPDPRHPERTEPRTQVWPDLPYHFLVAPDGRIFAGRPVKYVGQTNTPDYKVAGNINIELMGDFEKQRPSAGQLEAVAWLAADLARRYGIPADHVRGHRDAAGPVTDCPGRDLHRYFEDGRLRGWVAERLAGRKPQIAPGPPLPGGPTAPIPTTLSPGRLPLTRCPLEALAETVPGGGPSPEGYERRAE